MLERHIGLKVDVDTLRGTREGVPRLMAMFRQLKVDATFYFSVGPDHTGRALKRVFRKGFAQKVARTSVVKHYGIRTLLYGVLLPGPHIGRAAGDVMRRVRDAGFEVGLHTYDHIRWQDGVAQAGAAWTRREFERGLDAFQAVFGAPPVTHAAAGWQMNEHALALEAEYGLRYASDTRGQGPFYPLLGQRESQNEGQNEDRRPSTVLQLPTTLPTFDELLGRDGVHEGNIAQALFDLAVAAPSVPAQVFTLHAELEGQRLSGACRMLLEKWLEAGFRPTRMAALRELALQNAVPAQPVVRGEMPGRSGSLALQGAAAA